MYSCVQQLLALAETFPTNNIMAFPTKVTCRDKREAIETLHNIDYPESTVQQWVAAHAQEEHKMGKLVESMSHQSCVSPYR